MKNYLFFIAVLAILQSCTKDHTETVRGSAPYKLNNLHDYYVINDAVNTTNATFTLSDAGEGEIMVIPINLPQGVTVTPASVSVTNADTFRFTFTSALPVTGSYPVTLLCSALYRKEQTFKFNLISGADWAIPLVGSWTGRDTGSITFWPPSYAATVRRAGPNQVDIELYSRTIHCWLNGNTGTLVSDGYTGAYSFNAGTGTFSGNKILLNYSLDGYPNDITVRSTLTR